MMRTQKSYPDGNFVGSDAPKKQADVPVVIYGVHPLMRKVDEILEA